MEKQIRNGRVEYTEQEIRERAAAFDRRFGANAAELMNRPDPLDRELIDNTNDMLRRAGDRATQDRAVEQIEYRERQERFASVPGGWVPGAQSEQLREELRADWQRRQEWNATIQSGSVPETAQERTIQDLKPPAELTNQQIVTEAREIHAEFAAKMERWEGMQPGPEKAELREEMKPLVIRENQLREEYTGRMKSQEVSRDLEDRVPEVSIGYGQ